MIRFAPCKVIRIPESDNLLLVESGILGFGVRNPSLPDKESRIYSVESRNQDYLEFTWGDKTWDRGSCLVLTLNGWILARKPGECVSICGDK